MTETLNRLLGHKDAKKIVLIAVLGCLLGAGINLWFMYDMRLEQVPVPARAGLFSLIITFALLSFYVNHLKLSVLFGIAVFALVSSGSWAIAATGRLETNVTAAVKARLPKTRITTVNCDGFGGLCEVVAGPSLFYVDPSARFLVVGRIYDMKSRQDLTASRLLELSPELLVGGAARAALNPQSAESEGQETLGTRPSGQPAAAPEAARNVSLATLPKVGAIVWGAAGGKSVTVFTDFACSYCRALSATLKDMNVRVTERPISVLGTRALSEQVYCAKNQERALRAAYAGDTVTAPKCDVSGLDANERFARANGFSGTPVIVRSDGAVLEGYRSKEILAKWLEGVKS